MIELKSIKKSFLIDQTKQDIEVESLNGAVIGGFMDLLRLDDIASQYKNCADSLVDKVSKDREFAYEYAYPIIFLYRHYLETRLKSIFSSKKNTHSLDSLLNLLITFCEEKNVPNWLKEALKNRVNDFNLIDPTSTRFRYGSKDAQEEFLVDLSRMKLIISEFEVVISKLEEL